jgi:hypothetical protein
MKEKMRDMKDIHYVMRRIHNRVQFSRQNGFVFFSLILDVDVPIFPWIGITGTAHNIQYEHLFLFLLHGCTPIDTKKLSCFACHLEKWHHSRCNHHQYCCNRAPRQQRRSGTNSPIDITRVQRKFYAFNLLGFEIMHYQIQKQAFAINIKLEGG